MQDLVGSNLIAPKQSRVTFGSSCTKITKAFLHQRLLRKLFVSQKKKKGWLTGQAMGAYLAG
jgi:hypothetical protein